MRSALSEFLQDVNEVKVYLDLLQGMKDFARATTPAVVEARAQDFATQARMAGTPVIQIGYDGALLTLSASFEEFVANLLSRYTDSLPAVIQRYNDLPAELREQNQRRTGEVLRRYPHDRVQSFNPEDLVRNLYGCYYQGTTPYTLNGLAVALTDHNVNGDELSDVFGRVGITKVWNRVGRKTQVQSWFGVTKVEDAQAQAKNKLDQLMIDRNHTAHRGSVYPSVGPGSLKGYVEYFEVIAPVLVTVCEDQLRTLRHH